MMLKIISRMVFVFFALVLAVGCGKEPQEVKIKVSGKILSNGKPITGLPPGEKPMVLLTSKINQAQNYARVTEDGSFVVEVPKGDYILTGSAGFTASPNEKGPGKFTKDLKVESEINDLILDIGKK